MKNSSYVTNSGLTPPTVKPTKYNCLEIRTPQYYDKLNFDYNYYYSGDQEYESTKI
jgi:hypothetical protein